MKYHLEAFYLDGSRDRWPIFCITALEASHQAQDAARRLGAIESVTVYLFDAIGTCIGSYHHEPGNPCQSA